MREVVHRIGLPFRARTVVRVLHDAVDDRVAEVHVRVGHVDFGSQDHRALLNLATVHLEEEGHVLLDRPVAVGAVRARLGRRAFLGCDLLGRLLVDIGLAFLDQADGEVPELLEIIGRIVDVLPVEAQPLDVLLNGLDVFHVLLCGVCIIKTKVADAAVTLGDAEIHADRLGMANVQIAIGFGRESGLYPSSVLAFG